MAEDAPDAEDRTEAATPQRIEKARREGDVALSREAVQLASLGAGALGLAMFGPAAGQGFAEAGMALLAGAHGLEVLPATVALLRPLLVLALGVGGCAAVGAVAATFLQTGFLVHQKGLVPDPSKISPLAGFKRLFGKHGLEELARALLKIGAVGLGLWWTSADIGGVLATVAEDAGALAGDMASRIARLLSATLAVMAAIAALDLFWVRFSHGRKLRMSRQELRDETKENEGDPHLKARRLQIARGRSRRRMLEAVPKATVVITNPTHYAVALSYERGVDAAPKVVAKGVDALAARIRALAEQNGVPIVPNPPLARALYRLDDDAEIPEEHFKAVAEVIAFVWRLRGRVG